MSKLHDLITQLCPDGVPYKKLGEVAEIKRGERITKKDLIADGKYAVMSGGRDFFGRYNSYNRNENTITIAQYGSAGYVNYIKEKFWANDVCYCVFPLSCINNRYLYYVLKNNQDLLYKMTTKAIPDHLPKDRLINMEIPLPPLPVQTEIVRTLDSFTELEAELEAELAGRIEQYEYYRDYLLDKKNLEAMDGKQVETKKLGEVGSFIRGNGIQKKDFVDNGYPCIHYGQVYTYYGLSASKTKSFIGKSLYDKRKKANPGDLVIATTSENDEDVCKCVAWLGDVPAAVSGDAYIYSPIDELKVKYLAYFFQSRSFQSQKKRYITGTKVRRVNGESMAKIELPVPSLATQERIVDILDRFDTLTTSLTDGIPAEIAMRREQYEYYRSRLLDFPRLPEDSNNDGE